jgi:hypothetical protein
MKNEPLVDGSIEEQDPGTETQSNLPAAMSGSDVILPGAGNGTEVIPTPEVEFTLPEGYSLDHAGLWYLSESGPQRLCGPIRVLGLTRDKGSNNWGLAIEWVDPDGQAHYHVILRSSLIAAGQDLFRDLADCGLTLPTKPSDQARLKEALNGIRTNSRVRLVETTGWHGSVFVMPNNKNIRSRHASRTASDPRQAWLPLPSQRARLLGIYVSRLARNSCPSRQSDRYCQATQEARHASRRQ